QFVDQFIAPHRPSFIVEGEDFHFGHRRTGNCAVLAALGAARGFVVQILAHTHASLADQTIVRASSSITRWLIDLGRMADAAAVLAGRYVIDGMVVPGYHRGRTIGFPTANIATDQLLPADGVYAGTIVAPDGCICHAAINVGRRPTFAGVDRRLEV